MWKFISNNCGYFQTMTQPTCMPKAPTPGLGPISGATIPFESSQRRGSKPSNFVVLLVFLTLKHVKRSAFQIGALHSDNWLFGRKISRNRPINTVIKMCSKCIQGGRCWLRVDMQAHNSYCDKKVLCISFSPRSETGTDMRTLCLFRFSSSAKNGQCHIKKKLWRHQYRDSRDSLDWSSKEIHATLAYGEGSWHQILMLGNICHWK